MLTLTLENQVPVSLLRSDRWLYTLLSADDQSLPWDVALAALSDQQLYGYRKDDNESALALSFAQGQGHDYSLTFLQTWVERYLLWQGDCFVVKPAYLDQWQGLCAHVDPLLPLGWGFAELIHTGAITPDQLAELDQCPQALATDLTHHYADNHAHLGGHGSHRKALLDFAFSPYCVDAKTAKWPRLAEFSYLNSKRLDHNNLPRLLHALLVYLVEKHVLASEQPLPEINAPISLLRANQSLKTLLNLVDADDPTICLLRLACGRPPDKGCLLLFTALFYAERYLCQQDVQWCKGFRAFIHTSQLLRASMIHMGVGLGYFVDFFRFKLRKGENKSYQGYAAASDGASHIFREFKVSPDAVKLVKLIAMSDKLYKNKRQNNVHLCVHFTRSGKPTDKLQRKKRKELNKDRQKLIRLLSSFEAQNHTPRTLLAMADEQTEPVRNLLNLVRGLDVAGNENELAIEVFAPTIRVLRSCPWQNPTPGYRPPRRPHLSIHVGEDFKHLLSGLRHIDETVNFCEMGHGDRLGHALALGVSPKVWAERQGTVLISAGEHLDNLVWLHHTASQVAMQLPALLPMIAKIAQRICVWSDFIYGQSHAPETLWQAWQLRRNCPVTYCQNTPCDTPYQALLAPDFQRTSTPSKLVVGLWRHYFMSDQMSHKTPNQFAKPLVIRHLSASQPDAITDAKQKCDFFSFAELHLVQAIQDHLMQVYDQKGIVIEACPSSNIYTGHFNDYQEHPLYRWHPPNPQNLKAGAIHNLFGIRKGPLQVCINTDDAGLFPTTLVNEHRVIKETAIKQLEICTTDAQAWIDKIRAVGYRAFLQSHN